MYPLGVPGRLPGQQPPLLARRRLATTRILHTPECRVRAKKKAPSRRHRALSWSFPSPPRSRLPGPGSLPQSPQASPAARDRLPADNQPAPLPSCPPPRQHRQQFPPLHTHRGLLGPFHLALHSGRISLKKCKHIQIGMGYDAVDSLANLFLADRLTLSETVEAEIRHAQRVVTERR